MNYKSIDWNIVLAEPDKEFLLKMWLWAGESLFKYHIFPDSVTKDISTVKMSNGSSYKMIPVFLQATINKIDGFASENEYDLAVLLPRNLRPVADRTMRLAIYLSGIREITLSQYPIERYASKSKPSNEAFGTAGSFQGYRTVIDKDPCFCIPFGSYTLVIRNQK